MSFSETTKIFLQGFLFALTIFSAVFIPVPEARGATTIKNNKGFLGVIKGTAPRCQIEENVGFDR